MMGRASACASPGQTRPLEQWPNAGGIRRIWRNSHFMRDLAAAACASVRILGRIRRRYGEERTRVK